MSRVPVPGETWTDSASPLQAHIVAVSGDGLTVTFNAPAAFSPTTTQTYTVPLRQFCDRYLPPTGDAA